MSGKKLIYILNHFSENSSQHFFHILNLLEEIAKNDVSIKLIIEKAEGKPVVIHPNIEVYCLKEKGVFRLIELYKQIAKSQKLGYNKLFVRITNWGAVMAILNSFVSGLHVYYWHSGTVFEYDNDQDFSLKKIKWYFKTRLPFNFIKRFVTFFVTGPETMKAYYSEVVGVESNKIKILYNDIDTTRFYKIEQNEKDSLKSELSIPLDKKVILFVHKFSPVRKSKLYVQNFVNYFCNDETLSDCQFYFIGDGKDKKDIEDEISKKEYSKNVFFLGALPNAKVHQFYQIADIFINPTHAEGFPRVLIEAMACGLPVVTTNAGGIKDILGTKQLNYMSDINEPDVFAENLVKMAKLLPNELDLVKNENLEEIKRFSTSKVALMYIQVIFDN